MLLSCRGIRMEWNLKDLVALKFYILIKEILLRMELVSTKQLIKIGKFK